MTEKRVSYTETRDKTYKLTAARERKAAEAKKAAKSKKEEEDDKEAN